MSCPDANAIAAFVEGRLPGDSGARVSAHLAACEPCMALVAAAARGSSHAGAPLRLPAEPLAAGAPVGRYVILGLVGRGGMGDVYAAYDPKLDRRVALKLLSERAASPMSAARFGREAQAIARLSHPNVVSIYDAGEIEDRRFLAMEFVEGDTLADWLRAAPRGWRQIRDIFAAAGAGLAAAHEAGLVHRDFKPQNVMVAKDGAVRVMDFGLAIDASGADASGAAAWELSGPAGRPTEHTLALTRTGALVGTPLYMAPEQFLHRPTDARADQFSFCVALYEALFGERPFPAASLSQLCEAVVAGQLRDPGHKSRVPSFLRRLLVRGLQADPALRFPSMGALLDVLRYDPRQRRRSWVTAAVVTAVGIGAVLAGQRVATRSQRLCREGDEKLTGIWELARGGPRREAIHAALLATGRSFAGQTWERVAKQLDDYARRWNDVHSDACEATHVRGEQSAVVLDLRMTCLESARGALDALTRVLARADAAVVVEAVNAVDALPPVDRCSDIPALQAPLPPPSDPAIRARLASVRRRLAEVKALRDTGQLEAARRLAVPVVKDAEAIAYEPFTAEVLSTAAWLEGQSGAPGAAVKVLSRAALSGLAAHRDDIALEAVAGLVAYDGYFLGREEESDRWAELGMALMRRVGPGHERTAAWLYQGRAVTHERRGEYAEALAELQRALELKQQALPRMHPDLALTLHTMANVYDEMGRPADALPVAMKAVEIDENAFGRDSPLLATALGTRGESLLLLGRYAEAERDLRRAIELFSGWVGAEHVWTAYPLTALGRTLLAEQRAREAVAVLERALRIRERAEPNAELLAETRFALARASHAAGGPPTAARTLAIAARDAYRKLPRHDKQTRDVESWLATARGGQRR